VKFSSLVICVSLFVLVAELCEYVKLITLGISDFVVQLKIICTNVIKNFNEIMGLVLFFLYASNQFHYYLNTIIVYYIYLCNKINNIYTLYLDDRIYFFRIKLLRIKFIFLIR